MSMQVAPRLVRKLLWAEAELVEGTEALLWPALDQDAAEIEPPSPSEAFHAVLSWVRPQVLRFETASPEPLPELLLVSTLSVGGPALFVVRKSYQRATTAACEPPIDVHIVERRDLFRVAVAARVTVGAPNGKWLLSSMDCSLGGLRVCPPTSIEVGTEVEVSLELHQGAIVTLPAVVRHSHVFVPGAPHHPSASHDPPPPHNLGAPHAPGGSSDDDCAGCPSVVGLQFLSVPHDAERRLSEFVGRHQRRLMPKVTAPLPIEYCPGQGPSYLEARASSVAPGEVVFRARKAHLPGERMKVRMRLGRQDFEFGACVVGCETVEADEGRLAHTVKASLDESTDVIEGQFRKAVRELAIERVSSKRA